MMAIIRTCCRLLPSLKSRDSQPHRFLHVRRQFSSWSCECILGKSPTWSLSTNTTPTRQACTVQRTTHCPGTWSFLAGPTTKANGLSLAPGFTVQVQADNHDTTPRPCLHSCRQKNKAPPSFFPLRINRVQPMTIGRVL
jgi:hypothetical protein